MEVTNPSIPYLGTIYEGLSEGSSLSFKGSTPENMTRFEINLLCGESESNDIALHFNPRFDDGDRVVINTRRNGKWDSEDTVRSMPFSKGRIFEMGIKIAAHGYQIEVNGKAFYTFPHRLPLEKIRAMHVGGDVSIRTISVTKP